MDAIFQSLDTGFKQMFSELEEIRQEVQGLRRFQPHKDWIDNPVELQHVSSETVSHEKVVR